METKANEWWDWLEWLKQEWKMNLIPAPPSKKFRPVNPELELLTDYRVDPGDEWYNKFFPPWGDDGWFPFPIDTNEVVARAKGRNGFRMGVDMDKYRHTESKNNASVYEEHSGPQVMDALCSWWKKGIVKDPRKVKPEGVTVIKLTCWEKGPGRIRIIMDLSSPRGTVSYTHLTLPTKA